ncbi:MAG: GNAT family N-acetyltransferase [Ruminococcaceae bacterium]|nr:GNAT family N-acetyltransferase [Oscillospiraceae bacterium]
MKDNANNLPVFENIDRRIRYFEFRLQRCLEDIPEYELPVGYHFEFYQDGDRDAWIEIERSAKELRNYEQGVEVWERYYGRNEAELYDRLIFLVTDSGEKIGTATAYYDVIGKDNSGDGWLHWVAIKREYQGLGLSKPMISYVLNQLKTLGYTKAIIPTQTTTWVACKIYLDFGFRPTKDNAEESRDGYRILKRLTNHPALAEFDAAEDDEVLR